MGEKQTNRIDISGYSNILTCKTSSVRGSIEWYEYIVKDEQDFRAQLSFYFHNNQKVLNDISHIESINKASMILKVKSQPLTLESSRSEWLEIYWVLYLKGFIKICYNRTEPTGMWVFASVKNTIRESIH